MSKYQYMHTCIQKIFTILLLFTSRVQSSEKLFSLTSEQLAACQAVKDNVLSKNGNKFLAEEAYKSSYNKFYKSTPAYKAYKNNYLKSYQKAHQYKVKKDSLPSQTVPLLSPIQTRIFDAVKKEIFEYTGHVISDQDIYNSLPTKQKFHPMRATKNYCSPAKIKDDNELTNQLNQYIIDDSHDVINFDSLKHEQKQTTFEDDLGIDFNSSLFEK